ncbi:HD domain-containing protein [Miltoncostaea oceani]|uniref:HD domain-containing protein n=1 Tax=Miltoncostaea oceani TaxID=2843216 RepID=UPI001C3CB5CC|nr:HD domain-containing protein [Miltoncostaea oceani]
MSRERSPEPDCQGDRRALEEMLRSPAAGRLIREARDSQVLIRLLPELAPCLGYRQRTIHHCLTLDEHMFRVLDRAVAQRASMRVRFAALLHDIGKPGAAYLGTDGYYHYGGSPDGAIPSHEVVGAEIAGAVLQRLGVGAREAEEIRTLIRWHMPRERSEAEVFSLLKRLGPLGPDLCLLRRCDAWGKGIDPSPSSLSRLGLLEALTERPLALPAAT